MKKTALAFALLVCAALAPSCGRTTLSADGDPVRRDAGRSDDVRGGDTGDGGCEDCVEVCDNRTDDDFDGDID